MNSTVDEDNVVVEVAKSRGFRRQLFERANNETSHICDESEYATASESILADNDSLANKFVLVDTFSDEIEIQPYRDECIIIFFFRFNYYFLRSFLFVQVWKCRTLSC